MRHNQNGRRFRGRNNNNGNGNSGGNGGGQNHHHHNGGQRRINPRVQTFDSNGPDVRIRGNAMQITEKYLTLARDAQGAGDRVLAESYLQHAEHYQRMLNEANDEYNRHQAQFQQQHNNHRGAAAQDDEAEGEEIAGMGEQPDVRLEDLDQGFLVGRRNIPVQAADGEANGNLNAPSADDSIEDLSAAETPVAAEPVRRRAGGRVKETEAV